MSFSSYFWKDTISIIAAFGKIEICFQFLDCYKNIKAIHNFCLSRNCLIVTILRVMQEKHHFEIESFFFLKILCLEVEKYYGWMNAALMVLVLLIFIWNEK